MSTEEVPVAVGGPFDLPRLCRYFCEGSPQAMVAVEGPAHVIRSHNPAFARLVEVEGGLVGRPFAEAVPEGAGNGCLAMLGRVYRTGLPETLAEQEHLHRRGGPAYWSYTVWAILGEDGRPAGVMIQVTDATETAVFRKQARAMNEALMVSSVRQHELIETIQRGEEERRGLEARIFQAKKMESLGVLAGGIAHDLNNLLTPVLGYVELASDGLPPGSPALPLLEGAVKSASLAADLVHQVLAYAGKGRLVVGPVDLSRLVGELAGVLAAVVPGGVELAYELAPALPAVEGDATQLRQVVLNLVKNASEASEHCGGAVTVRTGPAPADPGQGPTAPPSVYLEVADTGCGMPADMIEKIFDPFFTTKFVGRGLGLAVVHGIVRGHHGSIQVRSEPGRGSTFRLLLPCSADAVRAGARTTSAAGWRGAGTVLVVDDEKAIRDMVGVLLKGAGLAVLFAEDGEDGLRVFQENEAAVDAVVLDVTMPRMGGREAAAALRALRPGLPVVLMSGYSVSEVRLRSAGLGITGFVQKPFNGLDLLAAVRAALGQ